MQKGQERIITTSELEGQELLKYNNSSKVDRNWTATSFKKFWAYLGMEAKKSNSLELTNVFPT